MFYNFNKIYIENCNYTLKNYLIYFLNKAYEGRTRMEFHTLLYGLLAHFNNKILSGEEERQNRAFTDTG